MHWNYKMRFHCKKGSELHLTNAGARCQILCSGVLVEDVRVEALFVVCAAGISFFDAIHQRLLKGVHLLFGRLFVSIKTSKTSWFFLVLFIRVLIRNVRNFTATQSSSNCVFACRVFLNIGQNYREEKATSLQTRPRRPRLSCSLSFAITVCMPIVAAVNPRCPLENTFDWQRLLSCPQHSLKGTTTLQCLTSNRPRFKNDRHVLILKTSLLHIKADAVAFHFRPPSTPTKI